MSAPITCAGAVCCEFRPLAGWWFCGCAGSLPGHVEVIDIADPAAGGVCAMAWRECRRCERIEECPAAELDGQDLHDQDEHRAGGFLRQDVPAGPALLIHTTTSHVSCEEIPMVEPTTNPAGAAGGAR